MDEQELALRVCDPLLDSIIEEVHEAFDSQREAVQPDYHAVLLAPGTANALIINRLIVNRLQRRFGVSMLGDHWMQEVNRCSMLVIPGDPLSVALRPKKYNRDYSTYQHRSEQQDHWRRQGRVPIPDMRAETAHLMLGYRCTVELVPQLIDIAISCERTNRQGQYEVSWFSVIWREGQGQLPVLPLPPDLYSPPGVGESEPGFKVNPKRPDNPSRRKDRPGEAS